MDLYLLVSNAEVLAVLGRLRKCRGTPSPLPPERIYIYKLVSTKHHKPKFSIKPTSDTARFPGKDLL